MGGNMKEKKRVHPTVDIIDTDILAKYGISPAKALKQRACQLTTGDNTLAIREELLHEKKAEYEQDISILQERVRNVEMELEEIYSLKTNFQAGHSQQYDKALGEVTRKLRSVLEAEEDGQWDLKKIPLSEMDRTCKSYGVSVESVLSRVPQNLLKYIEGYTRRA